ncbi:unnamed protein product [Paramecium pentaurelia]|uniref:Transmembrane protein n=1 Tax=Paramecium pentaurelia TaxID=43138 RepID=A0A8S1XPZ8_9CILI|nr:unnamed protein product [Paramecium pentaurelia]
MSIYGIYQKFQVGQIISIVQMLSIHLLLNTFFLQVIEQLIFQIFKGGINQDVSIIFKPPSDLKIKELIPYLLTMFKYHSC